MQIFDLRQNIGESLQDFARRTGRTIGEAYADWHSLNDEQAYDMQLPSMAPTDPRHEYAMLPHVTVGGGRCLGLLPVDVRNITIEARRREAERLSGYIHEDY